MEVTKLKDVEKERGTSFDESVEAIFFEGLESQRFKSMSITYERDRQNI